MNLKSSKDKRNQKSRRIHQDLEEIGLWVEGLTHLAWQMKGLILSLTLVALFLFEAKDYIDFKLHYPRLSSFSKSGDSAPEPKRTVNDSVPDPLRLAEVLPSIHQPKYPEQGANNQKFEESATKKESPRLMSFVKPNRSPDSLVVRNGAAQRPKAIEQTRFRELLSRTKFPINLPVGFVRLENGEWRTRVQSPAKVQSPEGYPMQEGVHRSYPPVRSFTN